MFLPFNIYELYFLQLVVNNAGEDNCVVILWQLIDIE